jgi:hypothetical protein
MNQQIIIQTDQVNTCNRITTEIEENFSDAWSIVTYDELGDIWIETFENDEGQARLTADRQHAEAVRKYKDNN